MTRVLGDGTSNLEGLDSGEERYSTDRPRRSDEEMDHARQAFIENLKYSINCRVTDAAKD
jgi:hypothetical protein